MHLNTLFLLKICKNRPALGNSLASGSWGFFASGMASSGWGSAPRPLPLLPPPPRAQPGEGLSGLKPLP